MNPQNPARLSRLVSPPMAYLNPGGAAQLEADPAEPLALLVSRKICGEGCVRSTLSLNVELRRRTRPMVCFVNAHSVDRIIRLFDFLPIQLAMGPPESFEDFEQ